MIKIYFTSAPFQTPNTGDCDYMIKYSNIINKFGIQSEIIDYSIFGNDYLKLQNKYLNLIKNIHNKKMYLKNYNYLKNDPLRINIIDYLIKLISSDKNKHKVLAIQYRLPDSGSLFFPDDLLKFKKNGIMISVTCHEFYLNILRKYLKYSTVKILNNSNLNFFFNKIDYLDAQKFGFKGKHKYTKQVVTLNLPNIKNSTTEIMKRPNNILFFGLIRPKKGIESALKLALHIYKNPHPNIGKVIIVGKCEKNNPLISCWLDRIKSVLTDDNFNVLDKYKHVLEIHVNIDNTQLSNIINKCKYAYKPDGKGFANNSSSIINLLNFGCITYTKWGPYTPNFITNSNSKYKYSVRLQDKLNKNILSNNKPTPIHVYNSIINSTDNDNLKSIISAKNLIDNKYNNYDIISKYCKNILIYIRQYHY
tara:strand:- start:401 stop:1660 length:1260 start_codon:yes stop_codon:yes gene_type:complete